jgi:hypothetical protein
VESVRYRFVEALFGLDRAARVQRDLQEDTARRALDAQVAGIELQAGLIVFGVLRMIHLRQTLSDIPDRYRGTETLR